RGTRGIKARRAVGGGTCRATALTRVDDRRARRRKIGMVEDVKDLGPELEGRPLPDPGHLCQGNIRLRITRSCQYVPSQIADRTILRRRKAGFIDPVRRALVRIDLAAGNVVRALVVEKVSGIHLVAF